MLDDDLTWRYDEFKQVGTDYNDNAEVEIYDSRHAEFRDTAAESHAMLDALQITQNDVVIDFGTGTGTFTIQAAKRCAWVHAVDVSQQMLARARSKTAAAGLSNVEFHHSGFLTYTHNAPPVDAAFTVFAFHHLPDFWKGIALKRIHGMLKPGGRFYLHDVIMEETNALASIAGVIQKLADAGGTALRQDTEKHFKEEFSTYDWVMDGLFTRSGFLIEDKIIEDGVLGTYICAKA